MEYSFVDGLLLCFLCSWDLCALSNYIMEYGSTPYVGMAWEKNGVHI